jgi:putative transposase
VERVKYEDVYIKDYRDGWELEDGLAAYFEKYNFRRRHQSINNLKPADRFFSSKPSRRLSSEEASDEKNLNLIEA